MPHVSVYVDESGDLGFSSKSTEFFSIGYVFTYNRFPTAENKVIKHTLNKINKKRKNKKRKLREFKFSNDSTITKNKFLNKIKDMDISVGAICISKDSVKETLAKDPARLYRYVIGDTIITHLVQDYFARHDPYNSIKFVIDRSLSESDRNEFNKYCEDKTSFRSWEQDRRIDYKISISHESSESVRMLQVADYIAGSIQRKFERNDSQFYDLIKHKIKYTEQWDHYSKINW